MDMITTFIEDTAIVADVFALVGQLAFIKNNLKSIVQYGGVKILLDIMTVFGDEELLMVSAVRTLDNIISADEEYANIVIDKGKAMTTYILLFPPISIVIAVCVCRWKGGCGKSEVVALQRLRGSA